MAFFASSSSFFLSAALFVALALCCWRLTNCSASGFAVTSVWWRPSSYACASLCAFSVSRSLSSAFRAWPAPSSVALAASRRLLSSEWSFARRACSFLWARACCASAAASLSAWSEASACLAQPWADFSSACFWSRASCVALPKSVSSWRLMKSASLLAAELRWFAICCIRS